MTVYAAAGPTPEPFMILAWCFLYAKLVRWTRYGASDCQKSLPDREQPTWTAAWGSDGVKCLGNNSKKWRRQMVWIAKKSVTVRSREMISADVEPEGRKANWCENIKAEERYVRTTIRCRWQTRVTQCLWPTVLYTYVDDQYDKLVTETVTSLSHWPST